MVKAVKRYFEQVYYGRDNSPWLCGLRYVLLRALRPFLRIRYALVARYLLRLPSKRPSILELGSGAVGISMFYPYQVIGLDLDFTGPQLGRLIMVKGDSRQIPFEEGAFDYVLSMDMLEHLEEAGRRQVIREMLRVARHGIILGFPSGDASRAAELKVWEVVCSIRGREDEQGRTNLDKRNAYLREHLAKPLPDAGEVCEGITAELARNGVTGRIRVQGNEPIGLWCGLMRAYVKFGWRFLLWSAFVNIIPVACLSARDPAGCYRVIIFVEKDA